MNPLFKKILIAALVVGAGALVYTKFIKKDEATEAKSSADGGCGCGCSGDEKSNFWDTGGGGSVGGKKGKAN